MEGERGLWVVVGHLWVLGGTQGCWGRQGGWGGLGVLGEKGRGALKKRGCSNGG